MTKVMTLKDLQNNIEKRLVNAMELTRDEIFNILSKKVSEYYDEDVFNGPDPNEPEYYQRTGRLMEGLTASHITKNGNSFECTVGWDDDYLSFVYPAGFADGGRHASGLQVLKYFNNAKHGRLVDGSHNYWDEAIDEINSTHGSIPNLFVENCIKAGIPIIK